MSILLSCECGAGVESGPLWPPPFEDRVIVTGKGNYVGTVERTFPIVRTDGVAEFTASAFAAAEGEKAVVNVRGGNLDQATSIKVVAVYNMALATVGAHGRCDGQGCSGKGHMRNVGLS